MNVLLFGELRQNGERLKQLIRENNQLCQTSDLGGAVDLVESFRPDIILLADVFEDSRKLTEYVRELENGDSFTMVVFARPEEASQLYSLRDAGVDECILESLNNEDRLRIRLAFVQRMAQDKIRRTRSEAELENRIRQESVLNSLAQQALAHDGSTELYEQMLAELVRSTSSTCAVLSRKFHDDFQLLASCGLDNNSQQDFGDLLLNDKQHSRVIDTSQILVSSDYEEDQNWDPPQFVYVDKIRSGALFPLAVHGETYGVLALYGELPHQFTANEIRFLETGASILAGLIKRVENEAKAGAILDTTIDGIITIDYNGYIESFNKAAEKLFGFTEKEAIGQKVNILMPEPYRSEHDSYMHNYKVTGERKIIGIGREVTGLHRSGSTFPMYLAVGEMRFNGRQMFTGIVSDISQQRELEQELLQSSEHERRRIGQDLHDGLGQMLSGVGMMTRQLAKSLKKEDHRLAEKADEITNFIKEADQYARQLSRGLMPVDIDTRGLATAFSRLIENARTMFQVDCRFHENNSPIFEDTSTIEHIYRIGQEAVSNAVKHGRATRVDLNLEANDEFVNLEVADNGKGFPKDWRKNAGMGMKIMQFRARLVGGTLEVFDREGGGTLLRCTIPQKQARYYLEDSE